MDYHPDNTASKYTTLLPKQVELEGEWVVGLSEIQFPCNFLHIRDRKDASINFVSSGKDNKGKANLPQTFFLPTAVFKDLPDLVGFMNNFAPLKDHIKFEYSTQQGFVKIVRHCTSKTCGSTVHALDFSDKLADMLGFERRVHSFTNAKPYCEGYLPASLARGLPESLFIYSDLCVPYVTGDVQSSLLRVVPFNASGYTYGATHCATFSNPHYIPLMRYSFRTIEIDIRCNRGEMIPFEYGPLNVTLHFKRID